MDTGITAKSVDVNMKTLMLGGLTKKNMKINLRERKR
jgi:hypothetical protein